MRPKIKEIIATGGKFGMRGDFLFLVGLVAGLLFILILGSRLLYYYISMNTLGSGVISKVDFG